jgi:hypothetical protein
MNSISKATGLLLAVLFATSPALAQTVQTQTTSTTQVLETAQPVPTAQIKTGSADEFLASLAVKFGTSVSRLKSLLAKLPPNGHGLNALEIKVIAGKLGLSKQDKAIFASKAGAGGTGFNAQDIAAMSRQLGLSLDETARLSTELGFPAPTVATPAVVPVPVGSTGSGM